LGVARASAWAFGSYAALHKESTVVILLINGPLGVGKTTIAWYLLEKCRVGVMLDGDYIAALHPFDHYNPTHLDYAYHTLRVLIAHHLAHGIRDFVLNWVFEDSARLQQFRHALADLVTPVLGYRLTCAPEELERRIRQRGFPDVEAEVERGRELIRLLDQAAVYGGLGHIIETTHRSAVVVAEAIWQHVQHVTTEGAEWCGTYKEV
jgi:broad-specificity NMP kinase